MDPTSKRAGMYNPRDFMFVMKPMGSSYYYDKYICYFNHKNIWRTGEIFSPREFPESEGMMRYRQVEVDGHEPNSFFDDQWVLDWGLSGPFVPIWTSGGNIRFNLRDFDIYREFIYNYKN